MIVNVTYEMLIRPVGRDRHISCPVAQAVKTLVHPTLCVSAAVSVRISGWVDGKYINRVIELPKEVLDFINKFDNGEEVEPFNFELELPQEVLK